MAVSDLTNTTWVIDDSFTLPQNLDISYAINFTSNNNNFKNIHLDDDYGEENFMISYYTVGNQTIYVYDSFDGGWTNQAYRTISITGGTDVTNATLIAWLEANATQQVDEPDVTYDLTQLDSYLVPGTSYTVTAKAVATGYADSVASNSVTYVPSAPSVINNVHLKEVYNDYGHALTYFLNGVEQSVALNTEVILNNVESLLICHRSGTFDENFASVGSSAYNTSGDKNNPTPNSADLMPPTVVDTFDGSVCPYEYLDVTQYLQNGCYVSYYFEQD